MLLWVWVTLAAAVLQVARTGLQKSLTADIDNISGTWLRYIYALPLLPFLLAALALSDGGIPSLTPLFLVYCLVAGLMQIIATFLLLALFGQRNFAVSTVFAKTEGLQIALLGIFIFAQPPSLPGLVGIFVAAAGIVLILPWQRQALAMRVVLTGLGAGFFFALTTWFIKLSYDEVEAPPLPAALLTLTMMVAMQSLLLGIAVWRRGHIAAVWRVRRRASGVGILSLAGSLCWFWAFALTNPAYVKTLAQIELPLAFMLGRAAFAERASRREIAGMVAVAAGAVIVIWA